MGLFPRRFTERGAPPGAVVASPQSFEPRLSAIVYDEDRFEESECTGVEDLPDLSADGRVHWVHVKGLGDGTVVQRLGEALGLNALAISDVVNTGQRPKVDEYGEVLFVVLHVFQVDAGGRLRSQQTSFFLGPNLVLSFQETHEDFLEPLRVRIRSGRQRIRSSGAAFLAAMIVDIVVDGYFPVLEEHAEQLEEQEEQILQGSGDDVLGELYRTRRDLSGFRHSIWPLREALGHLLRVGNSTLSESVRLHLRDTLDHTTQVIEVSESYRELAASLVDVHLSMVGQRTNDVMRVLTVVSAIFIPLTFVAGIYGMNFDTSQPGNLPELRWPHGYVFFWSVCVLIAGSLLLLFRRLGWLGGRP